eukprot:scaffold31_cov263-Pinguiococcus_pyrenoidosus.AAC.11
MPSAVRFSTQCWLMELRRAAAPPRRPAPVTVSVVALGARAAGLLGRSGLRAEARCSCTFILALSSGKLEICDQSGSSSCHTHVSSVIAPVSNICSSSTTVRGPCWASMASM